MMQLSWGKRHWRLKVNNLHWFHFRSLSAPSLSNNVEACQLSVNHPIDKRWRRQIDTEQIRESRMGNDLRNYKLNPYGVMSPTSS